MSSMGPVETLLVTVTTTTKRMSASWRKWEWLAIGPSSPLRLYPFVFSFNWHTEGGKPTNILSYHSPLPRFSIAWSRILPAGVGTRNPAGINYYHNLIGAKYYIHNQAHAKLRWMLSKDIHKYDQNRFDCNCLFIISQMSCWQTTLSQQSPSTTGTCPKSCRCMLHYCC